MRAVHRAWHVVGLTAMITKPVLDELCQIVEEAIRLCRKTGWFGVAALPGPHCLSKPDTGEIARGPGVDSLSMEGDSNLLE